MRLLTIITILPFFINAQDHISPFVINNDAICFMDSIPLTDNAISKSKKWILSTFGESVRSTISDTNKGIEFNYLNNKRKVRGLIVETSQFIRSNVHIHKRGDNLIFESCNISTLYGNKNIPIELLYFKRGEINGKPEKSHLKRKSEIYSTIQSSFNDFKNFISNF